MVDVYVNQKTFEEIVKDTALTIFEKGNVAVTSLGGIIVICNSKNPKTSFGGHPLKKYGYSGISTNTPDSVTEPIDSVMDDLNELSMEQLKKVENRARKLREKKNRGDVR